MKEANHCVAWRASSEFFLKRHMKPAPNLPALPRTLSWYLRLHSMETDLRLELLNRRLFAESFFLFSSQPVRGTPLAAAWSIHADTITAAEAALTYICNKRGISRSVAAFPSQLRKEGNFLQQLILTATLVSLHML